MNILVLSAGTRNLVLRYFKKTMDKGDKLFAADCSLYAPAIYEADEFFPVPRLDEEGYLESVLGICKRRKVDAVFSLIDPELSVLALHRQEFLDIGTTPIVSPYELVEDCLHKSRMLKRVEEMGYPVVPSFTSRIMFQSARVAGRIGFPVFVKPEDGSASLGINLAYSIEELDVLLHRHEQLLIQEYMQAPEIGVDAYVDMISGKCVSIFAKRKLKMRAGETDKSVSFKDKKLFEMVADIAERAGFRGMIDLDLFERNGEYVFSEINPRFGGGYPHAFSCGVNFPELILNNLLEMDNPVEIGGYEEGVAMMKYSDVVIKRIREDGDNA